MLSHDERRQLDTIEQRLRADDPELARLLSTWSLPRSRAVSVVIGLLLALGLLGVVTALYVSAFGLLVTSVPVLLAGWIWLCLREAGRHT